MEQEFSYEVYKKLKRRKRRNVWKKIVGVMMCLVVFWTTYMLILPALTKETKSFCGIPEHTHGAECYREVLLCQEHVHTDTCYEAEGALICTLSTEGHAHSDACINQTENILTCTRASSDSYAAFRRCSVLVGHDIPFLVGFALLNSAPSIIILDIVMCVVVESCVILQCIHANDFLIILEIAIHKQSGVDVVIGQCAMVGVFTTI